MVVSTTDFTTNKVGSRRSTRIVGCRILVRNEHHPSDKRVKRNEKDMSRILMSVPQLRTH